VNENDRPVLICYDGSDEAHRAIAAAAGLLRGRKAVVLDVGPPLTPEQSYAEAFAPVIPDFATENGEDALERARGGVEQAIEAGFDAVARSDVAAPTWEGIVDSANEIDAAVIVMGSHGWSAGGELVHGSVSHQVAAHAGRPVLIVPPPRG
jgi:nucleotide-binding universal stress UspA family protein